MITEAVIQQAENSIPGVRFTTAFLGNIPTSLSDDLVEPLLRACGPLRRWKRPLSFNGLPKPFGFAEYCGADGLLRCQRLLSGVPLAADQRISVKVDEATIEYLGKYEEELRRVLQVGEVDYGVEDQKAVEDLISIMARKHMLLAREHMEAVLQKLHSKTFQPHIQEEKENTNSSSTTTSSFHHNNYKRIVIRKKTMTASKSIDWTGFEEREKRYLAKEALRLEKIKRKEQSKAIDLRYKEAKISLFKQILSEYNDSL